MSLSLYQIETVDSLCYYNITLYTLNHGLGLALG